jgi:hypothetical protein
VGGVFQYQKFNSMISERRTAARKKGSRGQGESQQIISIRLCVSLDGRWTVWGTLRLICKKLLALGACTGNRKQSSAAKKPPTFAVIDKFWENIVAASLPAI